MSDLGNRSRFVSAVGGHLRTCRFYEVVVLFGCCPCFTSYRGGGRSFCYRGGGLPWFGLVMLFIGLLSVFFVIGVVIGLVRFIAGVSDCGLGWM